MMGRAFQTRPVIFALVATVAMAAASQSRAYGEAAIADKAAIRIAAQLVSAAEYCT